MKVALYARVSTKDKSQSTENQMLELWCYAETHSYFIYREYVEQESTSIGNWAEFQAMLADVHQQRFNLVLFWGLDRFTREGALCTLPHTVSQ